MDNKPYSYIDVVKHKQSIISWSRSVDGELLVDEAPLSQYLYTYVLDNTGTADMHNMRGQPVRKVSFEDRWEFRDWCAGRTDLYESDVQPEYKFLLDEFSDATATAPYNVLLYDIEVDFDLEEGLGYPTPKNPYGEINLFQAYDSLHNCYVMFMHESLRGSVTMRDDSLPVKVFYVRDERDLLQSVSDYIEHVDVMAGWFTKRFDLPYIMERAIKLFGKSKALSMFCRDGFDAKRRDFVDADYGEEVWEWTLVGRQHMCMMELYKKFIPGEKTSFSLNAVAEEDLGEQKDAYEGDLGTLYRENPQAFCNYGLQDVRLLKKLDDKHQIIRLAATLARMNCVKFDDVSGSVKPIEMGMMKFCHARGAVLPDKKHNEKIKFPGAIVYDTIAGLHGWMATIDLSGLYPSTLIMLGASPERIVMQCLGEYDDYIKVMTRSDDVISVQVETTGEIVEIPANEVESIIREAGYTISGNGTIFSGQSGYLDGYAAYVVALRSEYKKKMSEALKAGDEATAELYNLYQKVVKILANSIYGATGETSFRLYDLRVSKSITLSARLISKFQAMKSNDFVNQVAGVV